MKKIFLTTLICLCNLKVYSQDLLRRSFPASKEYKTYLSNVAATYNLELDNINIELRKVDFGVAFAYFDPVKYKRYIFLNEDFYNDFYTRNENCKYRGGEKEKEFLVAGTLAHEFAHHLLGHAFTQNTPSQEVHADEVSGIILSRYSGISSDEEVALSVTCLSNSTGELYKSSEERRKDVLKGWFVAKLNDYLNKNLINFLQRSISISDFTKKIDEIREEDFRISISTSNLKNDIEGKVKSLKADIIDSKISILKLDSLMKTIDTTNALQIMQLFREVKTQTKPDSIYSKKAIADFSYTVNPTLMTPSISNLKNVKDNLRSEFNKISQIDILSKKSDDLFNKIVNKDTKFNLIKDTPPTSFRYSFLGDKDKVFKLKETEDGFLEIVLMRGGEEIKTNIKITPLTPNDADSLFVQKNDALVHCKCFGKNCIYPIDSQERRKVVDEFNFPFIFTFKVLDFEYFVDNQGWIWRKETYDGKKSNYFGKKVLKCILNPDLK